MSWPASKRKSTGRPRTQFKCHCGSPAKARGLCRRHYRREPDQLEAIQRHNKKYYRQHRDEQREYFQRYLAGKGSETMKAYWRARYAQRCALDSAMKATWVLPGWGARPQRVPVEMGATGCRTGRELSTGTASKAGPAKALLIADPEKSARGPTL